MHEHDIQEIIAMNRITKLMHKAWFLKRQRRAVNFGHKFTITDWDVQVSEKKATQRSIQRETVDDEMLSVDRERILEELLSGFDPALNEADRRILFELTGLRIYQDEFKDHDTSSSEDEQDEESGAVSTSNYADLAGVDPGVPSLSESSQLTQAINP